MSPRPAAVLRRAPRARTRDPAEKRARAMAAARRLFVERGYAATTTADVAREAGVSEGILFHHFGSKEGLLAAVAGEYGRGLAAAMFEAAPLGPTPALGGGDAAPRLRLRARAGHPRPAARAHGGSQQPPDGAPGEPARRSCGALARAFADWSGRGLLRARWTPQIAAELLFALVEAALTECFVHGDGEREEDYLRETVRCVEGALAPLPDSSTPPEERSPSMSRPFPDDPFLRGNYAPWPMEGEIQDLVVVGEIPRELAGHATIRNGPNPQFAPRGRYHWFDGDGMIHAFRLRDGQASYRNRWVRTARFQLERAAGEALFGGLASMGSSATRASAPA